MNKRNEIGLSVDTMMIRFDDFERNFVLGLVETRNRDDIYTRLALGRVVLGISDQIGSDSVRAW